MSLSHSYDFRAVTSLEEYMSSMFYGEDDLKEESARRFSNSMFNAAVESIDKLDRE